VRRAGAALLLVAASVLAHWPPAGAGFAQDDVAFVLANASLRSPGEAARALFAAFPPQEPERALYRPLTHLSYAIDHALYGDRARGYHATNVALHAGVVLLVHRLARAYRMSAGAALAAALLFAAHPVHCEAVDAIAGRSELLALLFSLVSILLFLRSLRAQGSPGAGRAMRLASAGAQVLACLAKESASVLPGVLAVHLAAFAPPPRPGGVRARLRGFGALAPSLAALAATLALRSAVLGGFSPQHAPLAGSDLATRLFTMGSVFLVYLRLLVFPDQLQVDAWYQALVGIVRRPTLGALLGWACLLALAASAARLAVRQLRPGAPGEPAAVRERRAAALCAFAILFGFLLPVSHVVDVGVLAGERLLFAPSLGFVLLAVLAGERALARVAAPDLRRALAAAGLALLVPAGLARSALRAAEWRDPARLWLSLERVLPDDARAPSNLATVYLDRGDIPAAEAALARALALEPGSPFARGNLGLLRIAQDRLDEAEAIFSALAAAEPRDVLAWTSLARIEARRGRPDSARRHLERALALDPNFEPARAALRELGPAPVPGPRAAAAPAARDRSR
jgi:Flp pilus assembly protein TadD